MSKILTGIYKLFPCFFRKKEKGYVSVNNIFEWSVIEAEIVSEINKQLRIGWTLPNLKPDRNLRDAAKDRTAYFKEIGHPTHDGAQLVFNELHKLGLFPIAEVIEGNHTTAIDIVRGWKLSPDHSRVLKNPRYRYIGVSRIKVGSQYFVCGLVGKSKFR